ncbi:Aste57867_10219 [Aphanomyces stellatus]|uniref:Aste57867_10219 protein n=1 Tax=Aphanomyces stellatus TaxID=120398 RepID=A0A485KPT8_9STRA|nr:hypothetical protein As57867_010180 [Aphanomyces stellatus]VFT87095.1 Aste57867_10219 [Aphanomyces stellatus]
MASNPPLPKTKLRASATPFVFHPNPNAPSFVPSSFAAPAPPAPVVVAAAAVPALKPTAKEFIAPVPAAAAVPVLKPTAKEFVPSFMVASPIVAPVRPVVEPTPLVVSEPEPVKETVKEPVVAVVEAPVASAAVVEPKVDEDSKKTPPPPAAPVKREPEEESQPTCSSPLSVASTDESQSDSDGSAAAGRKRRITYTVAEMLLMEPVLCPVPTGLVICLSPPGDVKAARAAYKDAKPEHGHGGGGGGGHGGPRSERKKGGKKHKHHKSHSHISEDDLPPCKPLSINEETRWKPKDKKKKDENELTTDEYLQQVQAILNKLSVEKFERLSDQLIAVAVKTADVLAGAIDMVVKKAQMEWHFSAMYAELCAKMASTAMPLVDDENAAKLFRTLLLTRCQKEFEVTPLTALAEADETMTDEARAEKVLLLKRATLGHIRFIGELYKQNMLSARIMHECIQRLFGNLEAPDEESLECLCKLLATIGLRLEERASVVPQEAQLLGQYFDIVKTLSQAKDKLCTRVRFMLQDLIDLRANKYVSRLKEAKATTIAEIHAQAAREEKAKAASSGGGHHHHNGPASVPKPKFFKSQSMAVLPPPPKDGWEVVPQKVKLVKSASADLRGPPRSEKRADDRSKPRARRGSVERGGDRRGSVERPNIPRPAAASSPKKVAAAPAPAATTARSEDELVKVAKSMFKEFVHEQDMAEVVAQLHDALEHSQALTTMLVNFALEQKEPERKAVGPFLGGLAEKNLVAAAGILAALNELIEFLEDVEIDTPKAGVYLSEMVAPLLVEGHLTMDQIILDPLPDAKQTKLKQQLAAVLASIDCDDADLVEFIQAHTA